MFSHVFPRHNENIFEACECVVCFSFFLLCVLIKFTYVLNIASVRVGFEDLFVDCVSRLTGWVLVFYFSHFLLSTLNPLEKKSVCHWLFSFSFSSEKTKVTMTWPPKCCISTLNSHSSHRCGV